MLHSPEVCFWMNRRSVWMSIAQHSIQQFLKEYQPQRQITVLLTSHYMKDIAALVPAGGDHCRRDKSNTMDR